MTTIFWKGFEAEFTGNEQEIAGTKFYEIKMLEGNLKGQTKWVSAKYAGR